MEKMAFKQFNAKIMDILKGEGIDPQVNTTIQNDGTLEIVISQMYEYIDVTFEHLKAITELCGSKKLNIGQRTCSSGCETCDYGSSYRLPLYVMEPKIELFHSSK